MTTQSSTSDSVDDPLFQAFLNEPISESSTEAGQLPAAVSSGASKEPSAPTQPWWMKQTSGASGLPLVSQGQPQGSSWLKDRSEPKPGPSGALTPDLESSDNMTKSKVKEDSPGVVTSSATDSMAEFLEKESYFKDESEQERVKRQNQSAERQDGSQDYPEDFTEDLSDEMFDDEGHAEVKAIVQMLAKDLDIDLGDLATVEALTGDDQHDNSARSSQERSIEEILEEVDELEGSSDSSHDAPMLPSHPTTTDLTTNTGLEIAAGVEKLTEPELRLKLPNTPSPEPHKKQDLSGEQKDMRISNTSVTIALLEDWLGAGPSGSRPNSGSFRPQLAISDGKTEHRDASSVHEIPESVKDLLSMPSLRENIGSQPVHTLPDFEEICEDENVASSLKNQLPYKGSAEDLDILLAKNLTLEETLGKKDKDLVKQFEALQLEHERETLELKKQCYFLSAKLKEAEQSQQESARSIVSPTTASSQRVRLLESELQQQEQLIVGTQKENEKLFRQVKQLKVQKLFCQ